MARHRSTGRPSRSLHGLHAGVVDERVEPAAPFRDGFEHRVAGVVVGQVGGERPGPVAERGHEVVGRSGTPVVHGHGAARLGEPQRDPAADGAGRAGDAGDRAGQVGQAVGRVVARHTPIVGDGRLSKHAHNGS
jgi:hypothetical protein